MVTKKQRSKQSFSDVKSFSDLLDTFYLYFEGKIAYLPHYRGKLCADTIAQLDLIKEINRLGFLSVDSQNGLSEHLPSTIQSETNFCQKQRAYIEGFLPAERAVAFIDQFNQMDLIANIVEVGVNCSDSQSSGIAVTMHSWIENNEYKIEFPTHIHLDGDGYDTWGSILMWISPDANIDKIYYIQLIDPIWGRKDFLLQTMINILQVNK